MTFAEYCKNAKIDISGMKEVHGSYDEIKDYRMDPKGYFLIRINRDTNKIEVGLCKELNKISHIIFGDKPQDIYFAVAKMELVSILDHASYLGKELEKAYLALKYNLEYVQDDELNI